MDEREEQVEVGDGASAVNRVARLEMPLQMYLHEGQVNQRLLNFFLLWLNFVRFTLGLQIVL